MDEKEVLTHKLRTGLAFSLASLPMVAITVWLSVSADLKWLGLLIGIALVLLSIPIHFLGKKTSKAYFLSYFLNTLSTGFSISAYYMVEGIPLNGLHVILALVLSAVMLTLFFSLMIKNAFKAYRFFEMAFTAFYLVAILTAALFGVFEELSLTYSSGIFLLLHSVIYINLFHTQKKQDTDIYKYISFCSYGGYFFITVVILAILSKLDFLDIGSWGDGKKKK